MQIKRMSLDNIEKLPENTGLLLGYFNGLHIGHISLICESINDCERTALMTFSKSPKEFIKGDKEKRLMAFDSYCELLSDLHVDELIILESSEELFSLEPELFIMKVLKVLSPYAIYTGSDYHFGKGAKGDVEMLKKAFKNVYTKSLIEIDGEKISSSTIIKMIERGEVDKAERSLGREYSVKGKVKKGLGNGHKFGFPTANIVIDEAQVLPSNGVYISKVKIFDEEYFAATNVGTHPSVEELSKPIIEPFILDFNGSLTDQNIEVSFIKKLRNEIKFENLSDLICQIGTDAKNVERYCKGGAIYQDDIKTDRLLLRRFKESDLDDMYEWCKNPNVTKYLPWNYYSSKEECKKYLQSVIEKYKLVYSFSWAIEYQNKVIGCIDVVKYFDDGSCEIGDVSSEEYWGRGFMSEALVIVRDYLLDKGKFTYLRAKALKENIASNRVIEKAGFIYQNDEKMYFPLKNIEVINKKYIYKK